MGAHRGFKAVLAILSLVVLLVAGRPAWALDNPELLPDHPTPVIDLAKALSERQRSELETQLSGFEDRTGWKLRVLTQYERTPGLAVKDFWGLDERSLLLIADPRGGNLLNFNVGDAFFALMPRTWWVELQTRYGNQFYVRDNGEDGAIFAALDAVEVCLDRGGCQVVPGLPMEQWLWTLSTSILGGLIAGFAAYPRQKGDDRLVVADAALTAVGDAVWCLWRCPSGDADKRAAASAAQRPWFPWRRGCRVPHRPSDGRPQIRGVEPGLTSESTKNGRGLAHRPLW